MDLLATMATVSSTCPRVPACSHMCTLAPRSTGAFSRPNIPAQRSILRPFDPHSSAGCQDHDGPSKRFRRERRRPGDTRVVNHVGLFLPEKYAWSRRNIHFFAAFYDVRQVNHIQNHQSRVYCCSFLKIQTVIAVTRLTPFKVVPWGPNPAAAT